MKALTICQPYAELIARGEKRVENRTVNYAHRGPLLIHAGVSQKFLRLNERGTVDVTGVAKAEMDFGVIIGVCDVIDCVRPLRYITEPYQRRVPVFSAAVNRKYPWLSSHPHAEGPYCLILENMRRFETPIQARGMLGLWDHAGEIPEPIQSTQQFADRLQGVINATQNEIAGLK